jgi:uncharacterized protein (DUF2237 family)
MSSYSLRASRPSTFRAPGWGAPTVLPSCHRWRNATLWKLVPFSHRSASRIFIRQPGCIPSPVVTQDGDHQFDGGEKRAGLRPLPRPHLQVCSSSSLGRRARRAGALPPARVGWPPLLPASGGGNHPQLCGGGTLQPCRGRRTVAAQPGCNIPSSVLVFVARTGVRTCRCALGRSALAGAVLVDAAVGADVVAAGESFSTDKPVSATRGPTSWDRRCCCRGRWRVTGSLSSRRLSDVEVVCTRGGGTGVPFVMAP